MLISAIKLVLKKFCLPKRFWDQIVQAIAYVKNHIISQSVNGIIFYKEVNKSVSSIAHFCIFGYQYYIHFLDTAIYQAIYDSGQKSIIIGYERVNQQSVYNSRIRKIYVLASIRFYESFNYYDLNYKITDKDNNNAKLGNIQNKADDRKFGKVIVKKQGIVVADSEEERDNNSFLELSIDNNHPFLNQPMPSLAVANEIPFSLMNISRANISLSPETFHHSKKKKDLLGSPNILQSDNITD